MCIATILNREHFFLRSSGVQQPVGLREYVLSISTSTYQYSRITILTESRGVGKSNKGRQLRERGEAVRKISSVWTIPERELRFRWSNRRRAGLVEQGDVEPCYADVAARLRSRGSVGAGTEWAHAERLFTRGESGSGLRRIRSAVRQGKRGVEVAGLRSGTFTGQQFSGRSDCSQRISRGGSTWVVVAGLGEW